MSADVYEREMLSEDEVHAATAAITSLQTRWSLKGGALYTLGEPIYQNTRNMNAYYRSALEMNPTLWNEFGWVYKRMRGVLQGFLGEEVRFARTLALPGFHIFVFSNSGEFPGGSTHFDLPYQRIDWPVGANVANDVTPSFVLTLDLPTAQAGIEFWNDYYKDGNTSPATYKEIPEVFVPYTLGKMTIFDGHRRHRISRISNVRLGERRITCQGHCIRVDGNWIAYW
jgi:hypothetical protein